MAMANHPAPKSSSRGSSPVVPPSSPLSPAILSSPDTSYLPSALPPIIEHVQSDHSQPRPGTIERTSSISSVRFRDSPQGSQSPHSETRRASRGSRKDVSPPPPSKFQHHVSFDNFSGGKATEKNSISFTLNSKHTGYKYQRRSRTFMVGIDENEYSDVALKWMLEELVDDGDEIICLRVIEKDAKIINDKNLERRQYQKAAKEMMLNIQSMNEAHRAISIVLEFAVGELHSTFQQMIQLHEPAMLIVGTRGRSLGGLQGLMGNRNSFSKWCLQYSPIPVVVVRPPEKREKKKKKRDADPSRQDYVKMLRESGLNEHETALTTRAVVFEAPNTPDVEAHMVNVANGLPVDFDPKLRPLPLEDDFILNDYGPDDNAPSLSQETLVGDSQPGSPTMTAADSDSQSGTDSSDSENEFETIDGRMLLENGEEERKKRLHEIELSEAQALRARAPKNEDEGAERGAEAARKVFVSSEESEREAKRSSSDDDDSPERVRIRGERKVSTGSTASTASDVSVALAGKEGQALGVKKVDSSTSSSSGDGDFNSLTKILSGDSAVSPGTVAENHTLMGERSEDSIVSPGTVLDDPAASGESKELSEDSTISPGNVEEGTEPDIPEAKIADSDISPAVLSGSSSEKGKEAVRD